MTAIGEILKEITPYLGALISLYLWYNTKYDKRVKDKEDLSDKKHSDAIEIIKKIQITVDNHTIMHQSHQQEREKLVGLNDQRLAHIESKLNQYENVSTEVYQLKLRMEQYTQKIDNLIDSIKEQKAEHKESIKEIKDLISKKNTA